MRTHNNAKHRQPIQVPAIARLHAGRTACSAFGFPHARPHAVGLSPRLRKYLACLGCLLLATGAGLASPSSALREYKAGNYDQALKEYERLLQKKTDDPRLHFNAGTAAYRSRQFEEAAKQFNATLASPDLKLQGLAYYNEGNALYHLGEQNADPKQRTEAWEKALQNYQSTMKLNPQDPDAKFNYEYVKKKLEELKQQPQQSQQDKQDQKQDQDQQQDQNQQQQDQQKQDQQKQQDKQQQQPQQAEDDQKQNSSQQQQAEQQKKEQEQQQAAQQPDQQKPEPQQAQQSPAEQKDKSDDKEQEAAAAQKLAQMTEEQAQQLLDAQKGEEQMLPIKPTKPVDRTRPIKDW